METKSKSPVKHDFTASPVRTIFRRYWQRSNLRRQRQRPLFGAIIPFFFLFLFRENNGNYFPFFLFLIHPERIGKVKPCKMKRGPPYWDTRSRQMSEFRLLQGLNSIHDMYMLNRPRERFSSHHVAFMLVIQSEYIWDTWRQPQFFPESLQAAHER